MGVIDQVGEWKTEKGAAKIGANDPLLVTFAQCLLITKRRMESYRKW